MMARAKIIGSEHSLPVRLAKIVFGNGGMAVQRAESEIFGNQDSAVDQSDFGWLPTGAPVETSGSQA
jgi:hypothetical protein